MSRPLRIQLAGGLYHVTSRGDRREPIYLCEEDRRAWNDILGEVCDRFNWVSHGWCQMTNHYHLIVETAEGNLSQGMRQLNGVFTQRINRNHLKTGHVFQGRYKAILVERESYLLELARYVVLNPVRAKMVADAGDWPWSSFRAMVGLAQPDTCLQTDWMLAQFGQSRNAAVEAYINFVRAGIGCPSLWDNLRSEIYLGSDDFVARMQAIAKSDDFSEIPRIQRRPPARPLSDYESCSSDRSNAMAAAHLSGNYSLAQIAKHFGVHYATVSRAVARNRKTPQN